MCDCRASVIRAGAIATLVAAMASPSYAQAPQPAPAAPKALAAPARPLPLEEAIRLALQNNLNLRVERMNPELQDLAIDQARTAWTPNLVGSATTTRRLSPISSFFAGATDVLRNNGFTSEVGVNQVLPWGANYTVTWDTSRSRSNSVFNSPNPSLGSNLNFSFSQPLLKDFKVNAARHQLLVSKANREISDIELRQTVLTTIRSVKYAYWNLKSAAAALDVANQSLDLAREALRNNKSKVEIGTMAPIDVVEAEAEVARRHESVIAAEAGVRSAEDQLRTIILDAKEPDYWTTHFSLTDEPVFAAQTLEVEAVVRTALEKRTDLQQSRRNLEVTRETIKYQRNQTLPDLSAKIGYGLTGQGGTKINFGSGFPPPILDSKEEGWDKVISRLVSNDFHNWSVGVSFSYPLGKGAAEAQLARTRLQLSQAELQLQNLELQVATSVRDVVRNVQTNQLRLASSRATRTLMERRVQAEQKKFAAGLSTNFLVFQAQRDLADAQYAELVALLDYNKSLVDLETVQEAPTAGSAVVQMAAGR